MLPTKVLLQCTSSLLPAQKKIIDCINENVATGICKNTEMENIQRQLRNHYAANTLT